MVLKYIADKVTKYFETRENQRFEEFMQDVKIEAAYLLSHGENIRKMHESAQAWRIN